MKAADAAHRLLRNEIITCALEPGQQVAQPGLAARLNIGMTPIREALQRLEQEGLVQALPRFGYIVAPVTLSDVNEIYELRLMLELPAGRLAAARGSDEQLQQILERADFRYVYRDRASYSAFLTLNAAFHSDIAAASGNHRLAEAVCRLLDQMSRIFHLGLNLRDSGDEMREEHRELAEALCRRDGDRVERLTLDQIVRSRERVMDALMGGADTGQFRAFSQALHINLTPP